MLGSLAPIEVQAAVNSQVSVSNLQLVKSSRSGVDAPGQRLTAEDVATLADDWDATNAEVTSGGRGAGGSGSGGGARSDDERVLAGKRCVEHSARNSFARTSSS